MALENILREQRFTAGLAERHFATLAAIAREVQFQEDQLILLTGQRATHFFLLLSGSVCIELRAPVYTVCIQVLGPGEAFGWSSFLDHHDTLFQVRAREACAGICWDATKLSAACRENPEFGVELFGRVLELIAGRVKAAESKLAEFCGRPAHPAPGL
jgi:CRP-like cAMP-binding protein